MSNFLLNEYEWTNEWNDLKRCTCMWHKANTSGVSGVTGVNYRVNTAFRMATPNIFMQSSCSLVLTETVSSREGMKRWVYDERKVIGKCSRRGWTGNGFSGNEDVGPEFLTCCCVRTRREYNKAQMIHTIKTAVTSSLSHRGWKHTHEETEDFFTHKVSWFCSIVFSAGCVR